MGNKDLGAAKDQYKATTHATTDRLVVDSKGINRWARQFRAVEAGTFRLRVQVSETVAGLTRASGIAKGQSRIKTFESLAAGEKIEVYHDAVIAADDTTDYGDGVTTGTTVTKKFESLI